MRTIRITILLGLVLCLLTACPPIQTNVKITYPTEGSRVDQTETVKGTSQEIPNDSVIWIVVLSKKVSRYYPQNYPADLQANEGNWSSLVYIGNENDSGAEFDIIAVVADDETQNAFYEYLNDAAEKSDWPGLERLPEKTEYDRVTVTRK